MAAVDLITKDDLAPVLEELRAVRLELERLRAANGPDLVTLPEAARRLNVTLRSVQQRARDGRLTVEIVGGVRMVRLQPKAG